MSEFGTKNPCPSCGSMDVIPYPFEGKLGPFYKSFYPDAKRCVDCEYVWWSSGKGWTAEALLKHARKA